MTTVKRIHTINIRTAKCAIASISAWLFCFLHAVELRAAPVERDGNRVSPATSQSASEAKKINEAELNEYSAPTGSEVANSEGEDEWRRTIEGPLRMAEDAMLPKHVRVERLVNEAVQSALAADLREIRNLVKARESEQRCQQLECEGYKRWLFQQEVERYQQESVRRHIIQEKGLARYERERKEQEEQIARYNKRPNPVDAVTGEGFGSAPTKVKKIEFVKPSISIPGPLMPPPGFPKLARLAERARASAVPEIRDEVLAQIWGATAQLPDTGGTYWVKAIKEACGPMLKAVSPSEADSRCEENSGGTTTITLVDDKAATNAQGMYCETTVTGGPQGERIKQVWVMPKMMKSITIGQADQIIVRLDKQLIITVDTNEKTYSEVAFDAMEAAAKNRLAKVDSLLAELKNIQATMTDEQKKSMEKMMGAFQNIVDTRDEKIAVRNTGETKSISGFLCARTVVSRSDKTVMTLWETKDVSDADIMLEDWREFERRIMALSPGGMVIGDALKQLDGFPIQKETMDGVVETVTKIERKAAVASEFEVPAGFKEVTSQMLLE